MVNFSSLLATDINAMFRKLDVNLVLVNRILDGDIIQ